LTLALEKYKFEKRFDAQLKRMIKTPAEIRIIRKSARITDSCIKVIERGLNRPGITEKQLARAIDKNIRGQKAKLAFPTIVACGKRSVHVHAKPTDKEIRGLGYADFGAKYKGYCTDITVPFVKGRIDKDEQRLLDTTLLAYKTAVKSIKPGTYCWKLHDMLERFLRARGYKVRHGLGHGVGLDIHELPAIAKPRRKLKHGKKRGPRKKKIWERLKQLRFQPGMVFTIEPGIYVRGVGGCRMENDVLMTKHGPKVITHSRLIKVGKIDKSRKIDPQE
jgi:Xaa-Pro aminopeptidase